MNDSVLNIPAPMLEVARKLHEAMGLNEHGYTFEEFLVVCFLEGMLTKWMALTTVAEERLEIQKVIDEVSASHGMSTILAFLDQMARKIEVDK